MTLWKITNRASAPTMWCAHARDDISNAAARRLIKELLKKTKETGVSIYSITVTVDDNGTTATLFGTEQA